jgi:PhnB protein
MKVNTYLNFAGNCNEGLAYYEKNLGAKILYKMTFGEMPDPKNNPPGANANGVMHARFELGGTLVMASDGPPGQVEPMCSAYLCLSVDSDQEAERVYKVLSDGGQTFLPLQETFFAHRFAMLRDKFGISWMVIHERPMGSPQP